MAASSPPRAMDSSPPRTSSPMRGALSSPAPLSSSPPRTSSSGQGLDSPVGLDSPMNLDSPAFGLGSDRSTGSQLSMPQKGTGGRGDMFAPRRRAYIASDGDSKTNEPSSDGAAREVIWGTTVNVDRAQKRIKNFLANFEKGGEKVYPALIGECVDCETLNLNIDCKNVHAFDQDLYKQLQRYPQELVPIFDMVVNDIAEENFGDDLQQLREMNENHARFVVRPFNLIASRSMRNMDPKDIDQMVSVMGMVIRASPIIPDIQTAFFRCGLCNHELTVDIDRGRIKEPYRCQNPACQAIGSYKMVHNRCRFLDKQLVKVQETPESIPEGETPHTIDVYCYDSLVDYCKPGDRVTITGIYRASPIRISSRKAAVEAVYKTYLDAVHFKKANKGKFAVENAKAAADSEFATSFDETDETVDKVNKLHAEIKEFGKRKDVYEVLAHSFAPSVWEMEDVKKGILCQLFGACNKDLTSLGGGKFRGEMNVLMCGDPGTSKSQLLQYVHKIAPRGIYTSGKGSSAVGLTAYITKDPDTGDSVLESGALVLSDRGICCIDEFDKMGDGARSILHEVMEQQTVSIAKAGIICQLNARTSILAAANPRESRYNPTKSVVENIDLPPTLMSRFDLIYLILDKPNPTFDRRLAKHIVSLYYKTKDKVEKDDRIDMAFLMEYISWSKQNIEPQISEKAVDKLVAGYTEMRNMGRHRGRKVITATPRQLESLIRLSESLARIRHSMTVDERDVEEAIRLMKVATQQAATDPRTGEIDMGVITTGQSEEEKRRLEAQSEIVSQLLRDTGKRNVRVKSILAKFNEKAEQGMEIGLGQLKKILEVLVESEQVRVGQWIQDDPMVTKLF